MKRLRAALLIVPLLLASVTIQPLCASTAAGPGGSISVDNTQSNGASTGVVRDESQWPVVKVALKNDHTFWLRWSIYNNTSKLDVANDNAWAKFGYIAPGAEAEFTITFDQQRDSSIQFFLDAGRTKDGSLPAAVVTILQRTMDTIFTAAGGSKTFASGDAQQVMDALAQFQNLPDCIDAAQSAISTDPVVALQFPGKFWHCLTDPQTAAALAQIAANFGVTVGVETIKNVILTPLKIIDLTNEVVDTMAAIISGSWAGSVVFESRIALPGPGSSPAASPATSMSAQEIVSRVQAAVKQAQTYRYHVTGLSDVDPASGSGEVNLAQGTKFDTESAMSDGPSTSFVIDGTLYHLQNGAWAINQSPKYVYWAQDFLVHLVNDADPLTWVFDGVDSIDGKDAYIIESVGPGMQGMDMNRKLWVDAITFLPVKMLETWVPTAAAPNAAAHPSDKVEYTDFGASIEIQLPPEALQPTPTPEPANPSTSNSPMAIAQAFMAYAMAGNFMTVKSYFAPDKQPSGWAAVFSQNEYGADVSKCDNIPYQTVERDGSIFGEPLAQISFAFSTECAIATGFDGLGDNVSGVVMVELEQANGRWYVDLVQVMNPHSP